MDGYAVRYAIEEYFKATYHIKSYSNVRPSADGKLASENQKLLETAGYVFCKDIVAMTKSGEIGTLKDARKKINALNDISFITPLDTHKHGRQFHHHVADIGLNVHIEYDQILTVIRYLFGENNKYENKILALELREVYSFVINNAERLKDDILASMSTVSAVQLTTVQPNKIRHVDFSFPQILLFTYDGKNRVQKVYTKNVYDGYRSSAEPRSGPEKEFELYLERAKTVSWFYKNGDKGAEYLSIVYVDSMNKQHLFYPDYVVEADGKRWILETKGGFSNTGVSQNIDPFSAIKFMYLYRYLKQNALYGGFVRKDDKSGQLFICTENYTDDIGNADSWRLLSDVIA